MTRCSGWWHGAKSCPCLRELRKTTLVGRVAAGCQRCNPHCGSLAALGAESGSPAAFGVLAPLACCTMLVQEGPWALCSGGLCPAGDVSGGCSRALCTRSFPFRLPRWFPTRPPDVAQWFGPAPSAWHRNAGPPQQFWCWEEKDRRRRGQQRL